MALRSRLDHQDCPETRYSDYDLTLIMNAGAVMKLAVTLCLLAIAAVASAEVNGTVETSSKEISSMPATAFVYNPLLTNDVDVSSQL